MEQRQKTRKSINFTRAEWKPIAVWIKAQRPRISEAEGLRRLVTAGAFWHLEQLTRKRAEP